MGREPVEQSELGREHSQPRAQSQPVSNRRFAKERIEQRFEGEEEFARFLKPIADYAKARARFVFEYQGPRHQLIQSISDSDAKLAKLIAEYPEFERRDVAHYVERTLRREYRAAMKRLVRDERKQYSDALSELEHFVYEGGLQIGILRGESETCDEVNLAKMNFENELKAFSNTSHKPLFDRYPFLSKKLEHIRALGEEEGEQRYLRARNVSSNIRRLIKAGQFDQLHQIFSGLSIEERELVDKVHQQVFQVNLLSDLRQSFHEVKQAFEQEGAKLFRPRTWGRIIPSFQRKARALKRWIGLGATLKTALQDKYGAEAGIVVVAWEKLQRVGLALSFSARKRMKGELSFRKAFREFLGELSKVRDRILQPGSDEKLGLVGSVKRAIKEAADIDKRLLEFLEDSENSRLENLLRGNKISSASDAIFLALSRSDNKFIAKVNRFLGIRGRAESLFLTMDKLRPEELRQVEEDFKRRHADKMSVSSLREAFKLRLRGAESDQALATLDGEQARRLAARLKRAFETKAPKDDVAALRTAAERPGTELTAVAKVFLEHYKIDLSSSEDLKKHVKGSSPQAREWIRLLFSGELVEARAARLDAALNGKTKEWIGEIFYDHERSENQAIIDSYNARPAQRKRFLGIPLPFKRRHDFWSEYRKKFGAEEADIMTSLVREGTLSEAEQLRACMLGKTVNTKGILSVLRGKTIDQQDMLAEAYKMRFRRWNLAPVNLARSAVRACALKLLSLLPSAPSVSIKESFLERAKVARDLNSDLKSSLCGHHRFDALMLRRGYTSIPAEIYKRMQERQEHERSGLVSRFFEKTEDGKLMRKHFEDAESFYKSEILGQPKDPEKRRIFHMKVLAARQGFNEFRKMKERFGNLVANVTSLAAVVSPGLVVGTSFALYPFLAPLAFGMSFASRFVTKHLTKGKGYGKREMGLDLYLAAVDGITVALFSALRGLYVVKSLAASRPILLHGTTTIAKGQAKGRMRKVGMNLFSRRYQELESGHALRLKELEIERRRLRNGQRIKDEVRAFHQDVERSEQLPEVGVRIVCLAIRFQNRGQGSSSRA